MCLPLWLAIAAAPQPTLAATAPATTSVPLEVLRTGHIAVQVRVNDQGPFRLVLDTGSPVTFITARVAERAGLITAEGARGAALLGMRGQVTARRFQVGAAMVEDLRVLVLDHPIVELVSKVEGPLDGIVGFSFFARYRMTIDYQTRRMTLTPTGYLPQEVMTALLGRLLDPKPRRRFVAPAALWGMEVAGEPEGTEPAAVRVTQVFAGSPAAASGLKPHDRVTALDGRWTTSVADLYEAAALVRPGREVEVVVVRDGKEMAVRVRPRPGL